MWIRWQTRQHSSSYGAVELSLAAAHRWVSLFTVPCFLFLLLRTCSKNVTFDCHLCGVFFWFFLEELCLELARAIEAGDTQAASQHASALARQKAVLTIQLSEKNYGDGEIGWEMKKNVAGFFKVTVTDLSSRLCVFATHSAISVLQFICGSGGCVVILLCHSESLSLHDCGCTQATG